MSNGCLSTRQSPLPSTPLPRLIHTDVSFPRGYDFGYLLKILTCESLPANEHAFFSLLAIWFPCIYDIKHVVRSVKTLRGGLQDIAESLGVSASSSSFFLVD